MTIFSIEHGKAAYQADFALYSVAIVLLFCFLWVYVPTGEYLPVALHTLLGLCCWTAIEYALHRFILHEVPPFCHWHAEHHHRPRALICTPTLFSASLIAFLVFLPAALLTDLWRSCGLTLGVLSGYFVYSVTHHAIHHWRSRGAWLKRRKIWHALHHRQDEAAGYYGVTNAFWDHVLGSGRPGQRKNCAGRNEASPQRSGTRSSGVARLNGTSVTGKATDCSGAVASKRLK